MLYSSASMHQVGRIKMAWFSALTILLLASFSQASEIGNTETKTASFLSPKFVLKPGYVMDKFYHNIEFPKGHIAVKGFYAEVVDDDHNPVPLHELYLHHWIVMRYYQNTASELPENTTAYIPPGSIVLRNSGTCQGYTLGQYFGLGSETRRTSTRVPDPYGIEIGRAGDIPKGYDERWMVNIHAIDTRGAEDRMGCTECRCDLYNVTIDRFGKPLPFGYTGGLSCCYDGRRCRVEDGFENRSRSYYLKYTVRWVEWDESVAPVKIYVLDVTDRMAAADYPTPSAEIHDCRIEYEVKSYAGATDVVDNKRVDTKRASMAIHDGGYLVYGVAHQHSGGIGSTLYGNDGRVLCSSIPTYGNGTEVGDEAGYITGMSTCYPLHETTRISDREVLTLESKYDSSKNHTGVMGLFYILVSQPPLDTMPTLHIPPNQEHANIEE